jgi:hypothetical protein
MLRLRTLPSTGSTPGGVDHTSHATSRSLPSAPVGPAARASTSTSTAPRAPLNGPPPTEPAVAALTPPQAAAQHGQLARRHRDGLARLPGLAAYPGPNEAIADVARTHLASFPPNDRRRIEWVRTAANFLDRSDAYSFGDAQAALCELAIGRQPSSKGKAVADDADDDALRSAWGTDTDRLDALHHSMPHWLANETADTLERTLQRLSAGLGTQAAEELSARATRYIATRDGGGTRLPKGNAWLASGERRAHRVTVTLLAAQAGNHLAPAQVLALASDLPSLKGLRHHFVRFVGDLVLADSWAARRRQPEIMDKADRLALMRALVAQLPDPGFGARRTQNELIGLVGDVFALPGYLGQDGMASLAVDLLQAIEHLDHSRVSGVHDVQGRAVDALSRAVQFMPARHAAVVLDQLLDRCDRWSRSRRPAWAPGTQTEQLQFAMGLPMTGGTIALAATAGLAVGRRSVRDAGLAIVSGALERLMPIGADAEAAQVLLPVCRRILNQPGRPQFLRDAALAALLRGGLPFDQPPDAHARFLELAFGDTAAQRGAAARTLMPASLGRGVGQDHATRLAAARCLHHVLAAGTHDLSEQEQRDARAAAKAAFEAPPSFAQKRLASPEHKAQRRLQCALVAAAMQAETRGQGDGPDSVLARRVLKGFAGLGSQALARALPHLVRAYKHLTREQQVALGSGLLRHLSATPVERGPGALTQNVGLSLLRSLSNCVAEDPAHLLALAREVWPRLNTNVQQAALHDLFDGFETATAQGQRTVLGFVAGLGGKDPKLDHDFATAAARLVRHVLGDRDMRKKLADEVVTQAVNMVLARLAVMPSDPASDLVANAVAGDPDLPPALWQGMIAAAPGLKPHALRALLTTHVNRWPKFDGDERKALNDAWTLARAEMAPASRAVVDAFMQLVASATGAQGPIDPSAAAELAAALPAMSGPSMQAALPHVEQATLTREERHALAASLIGRLHSFPPAARQQALRLCIGIDPARTLHLLAERVGMPEVRQGGIHRPALDGPVPLPSDEMEAMREVLRQQAASSVEPALQALVDGGGSTLLKELQERHAGVVAPALEALAEHCTVVPASHAEAIAKLIASQWMRLSTRQADRLRETLLLANPDLTRDDIARLGGDPDAAAWKATAPDGPRRLQELRDSRFAP